MKDVLSLRAKSALKRKIFGGFSLVCIIFTGWGSAAFSQEFECKILPGGGVEILGVNKHDRVLRCDVSCEYWVPDGSKKSQTCKIQMQPNSTSTMYCSWNLNNAKTVIGLSHSCQ